MERATRECLTSPTIATRIPAKLCPRRRRRVKASRRAWVGCSCQPSPALTTEASIQPAIRWGTPLERWRTTMASIPMASTVRTVSSSDSPLRSDDDPAEKVMVSADSRLAAVSNESRVRVESS